jgi:hypothetical protein
MKKRNRIVGALVGVVVLLCIAQGIRNRFLDSYDTVQDMVQKAGTSLPFSTVVVLGYKSPGDGGGGTFILTNTATATNYGTRIYSGVTGKSWQRVVPPGPYSVAWFGAMGDTTDEILRIQATADAAGINRGIWFPKPSGAYYGISDTIKFRNGQSFTGQSGPQLTTGQTEIRMLSGNAPVFAPFDTAIDTVNITIANLKMTGAGATTGVINFYRTSFSLIKECSITGGAIGILMDANVNNQCYFNGILHTTVHYLSTVGIRFQNGANANYAYGCVLKGTPRSVEVLSASSANTFVACTWQGVAAPDDTVIHAYVDGPILSIYGGFMEGTAILKPAAAGSTTTVFQVPTLGASVDQYVGYKVWVKSGLGVGQAAIITANTATTITVTSAFGVAPDATSVLWIGRTTGVKITANGSVNLSGLAPSNCMTNVDDGGTIVLSGTATSGTGTTLTDTGKSMTVNQYAGYRLRTTGGTGPNQNRLITANTATAFTVGQAWQVTPDAATTYRVEESGPYAYNRWMDGSQADSTFPGIRNRLGMLEMDMSPSTTTMGLDIGIIPRFGIENVTYNWGKLTQTTGSNAFNFFSGTTNTAIIDFINGNFKGGAFINMANGAMLSFPASFKMQFTRGGGSVDSFYLGTADANGTEWRNTPGGAIDFRTGDNNGFKEIIMKMHTTPQQTVTWASTTTIDLSKSEVQTLQNGVGNVTYQTSNRAVGRQATVYITGDTVDRTPTWPAWKWIGNAVPSSIQANRIYKLTLFCTDANETGIYASLEAVNYNVVTSANVTSPQFGADRTGVADSTAAFQAAANSLNYSAANVWSQRGGKVWLPNGVYRITGRMTVKAGTIFEGESQEGVIIIPEHTADDTFYCETADGSSSTRIQQFVFRNLTIAQKTGTTPTAGAAIHIRPTTQVGTPGGSTASRVTVDNCYIYGTFVGLNAYAVQGGLVKNTTIKGCQSDGMLLDAYVTNTKIEHCYMAGNGVAGTGHGYHIKGATGLSGDGNAADSNKSYGVYMENSTEGSCFANKFHCTTEGNDGGQVYLKAQNGGIYTFYCNSDTGVVAEDAITLDACTGVVLSGCWIPTAASNTGFPIKVINPVASVLAFDYQDGFVGTYNAAANLLSNTSSANVKWSGFGVGRMGISTVTPAGILELGSAMRVDLDATAGNTRALLWDVTAGALKRVSIGATDSGGVGFKLIRIPN